MKTKVQTDCPSGVPLSGAHKYLMIVIAMIDMGNSNPSIPIKLHTILMVRHQKINVDQKEN